VRLEVVRAPNALHRRRRTARRPRHRPAGPLRDLARRLAAGQRHDARDGLGWNGPLAGLAGFVAQQPVHAHFGEALLPSPNHRTAHADLPRYSLHWPAARRGKNHLSRSMCLRRRLPSATTASNRSRSDALTITHTVCAMNADAHNSGPP